VAGRAEEETKMTKRYYTKRVKEDMVRMLCEIIAGDFDFFDNNFDSKECMIDGAMKCGYDTIKKYYDEYKKKKEVQQ
jgi:hypothetical protein